MRFEFCGNIDCPEWVVAEIPLVNKMSAVKLKIMLSQLVKKVSGLQYDLDKLHKLCKDQKLDIEESRCLLAILEFVMAQAAKHDVSEQVLGKDLMQMGVAIENSNGITKVFGENQDALVKAMKNQSMRVSQMENMSYKISYVMASSFTGYCG